MKASADSELVIEPLTTPHWSAFADLLDQGGPAGRCWCVAPMGIDYRRRPVVSNRADLRRAVKQGPPPGLLALRDQVAVGWCRVTPRDAVPGLERAFRTRRVDDIPVWSISCFYIRKGHRRKGIMTALISAAIDYARAAGRTSSGGLSPGRRGVTERDQHRLRIHLRQGWLLRDCPALTGKTNHAHSTRRQTRMTAQTGARSNRHTGPNSS
jgi:GNAT superfamily N-acetyltransferase